MKQFFLLSLFLFLTTSCSTNITIDSVSVVPEPVIKEEINPYQLQESVKIHIDYVQYLEETDEYALPLKWKKDADVKLWYESIAYDLPDIIYSNDSDYSRYAIPDSLIPQFFDMSSFNDVKLYNKGNSFVGEGEFIRFEFIDQNIDPIPVAIYRLNEKNEDALYAVAGLGKVIPEISSVEAPEERLNQLIEYKMPKGYKDIYSLRCGFLEKQFYAVQCYEENGFNTFIELYKEENGQLLQVYKDIDDWYFFDIHPISIYYQEQPLLLCNFCKAESDWFQSGVLIFKNGKYVDF